MSRSVRLASFLALVLAAAPLAVACGASRAATQPSTVSEPSAATPEPAAPSSAAAEAPPAPEPAASAPATVAPATPPSAPEAPPPPCIGGEIMMGGCICPHGKGVDDTGHCVYAPCPKGSMGGTVFRDEETGQCLECRPGTRPSKGGKCEAH